MSYAHENAFRRWSVPDAMEVQPEPITPVPPTDRQDTMEAHMPSSFRVYSPAETRNAPMRRSYHSFEGMDTGAGSDSVGARTLLKWTGIGILAGFCVLTTLILVLNLGDDGHRVASTSARATIGKIEPAAAPAPVTPANAKPVATPADIELEASPPPAPKKATIAAKKPAAKKK